MIWAGFFGEGREKSNGDKRPLLAFILNGKVEAVLLQEFVDGQEGEAFAVRGFDGDAPGGEGLVRVRGGFWEVANLFYRMTLCNFRNRRQVDQKGVRR